ncbi:MAG: NAD(P)H-dependent oxidoreductase subunit E, partial [Propionibacteriaceae bacterium]|nr:NAD(P)H-dependent oxidoreductase subunit E [Propionibacteriaceae bacterium]
MNATNQKGQTDVVSSQVATIVEKYRHSPHMFLRMLLEIQQVLPGNAITENVADLVSEVVGIPQAKLYGLTSFYSMLSDTKRGQTIIRMCMSAPCQVRGAMQVAQGLLDELNLAAEQQTTADGAFTFEYCECLGVCDKSPAALIDEKVHPNLDAVSVTDFMLDLPSEPPVAQQPEPVLLKNVGLINPIDAKAYLEAGGYLALKKVLDTSGAEIISMIEASGLRGRGGAGFPTGLKWKTTYDAPANQKYVVCNADEGEPGTNKDRLLLAGDPNLIFEGMAIAGKAVGASKGIIYLRSEYQCLLPTLETAVENAVAQGCLGKSIFGSDFDFDIEVCTGAGAYICGEESALLNSIEGKRGEPRLRPPYPASVGLYGKPTVINNVETLANVPLIMANTADWYRGLGTKTCPGTKLYTVSGNVKRRGVY